MSWNSLMLACLLLHQMACQSEKQGDSSSVDDTAPIDLSELSFGAFENWDFPVADYAKVGNAKYGEDYMRGIHDVEVFEDRLYFGFGDANVNIGRIFPIPIRAYTKAEPGAWAEEFTLADEQIDHFRESEGWLLIPGVDATEDAFLGNAYVRPPGGSWSESRTLDQGIHVHDMARVGEALFACGSGGVLKDYEASNIHALLWRSDDAGQTFSLQEKIANPYAPGDSRMTSLLVVDDVLYGFGYRTAYEGSSSSIVDVPAWRMGTKGLEDWGGVADLFVTDTFHLAPDAGLVVGVDVDATTLGWRARILRGGAADTELFPGMTVLDVEATGDGRSLVLALAGDAYPTSTEGPWDFHIFLMDDGSTEPVELTAFSEDTWPLSLAWWQGGLYLGLENGRLQRAVPL